MNTILLNTISLDGGKVIVKGGGAQLKNQAKTIEITENGTTEVTHDTGFTGLSNVTINTNVQGGVVSASANDVNFRDYDGTILHSYTKDEFLALSALPNLPTREGLICQEWNWSFEDAQEYVAEYGRLEVGATYITDDGKTRLYIRIAELGRMDVPLYFSQTVANGVTIDWGDGSATETLSGTGNKNTKHIYADKGDYCITLEVADGCELGFGDGSSTYSMIGNTSDLGRSYLCMPKKVEIGKGVSSITRGSFYRWYSLVSLVIPNSITSLASDSFLNCHSLTSVVIPKSIARINSTLTNSYSLASVAMPNVEYMTNNIFEGCLNLTSIIIPQNITTIYSNTFNGCRGLSSITIPKNVKTIGSSAFYRCVGMALYDFRASTSVPTLESTSAFTSIPSDCKIVVPNKLYSEWISATNWSTYASQIFKASDVFPSDEPEDEVIEYHFEFNNLTLNEEDDPLNPGYYETQYGDFSELHNKLVVFMRKNGEGDSDDLYCDGEVVASRVNITLNGYKVNAIGLNSDGGSIYFDTSGPSNMSWDTGANLYTDNISYWSPSNEKGPDAPSGMIERHFEFDLVAVDDFLMDTGYIGDIKGDFSDLYNELSAFVRTNGDGYYPTCSGDVLLSNVNITLNGYRVTSITLNDGDTILILDTDGPTSDNWVTGGNITPTIIGYTSPTNEKGPDAPSDVMR